MLGFLQINAIVHCSGNLNLEQALLENYDRLTGPTDQATDGHEGS